MIAVHVTHEAVEKMGGIGAVVAGLVTSPSYQQKFSRTVLVGPLFSTDAPAEHRLGPSGKIIYSSLDNIDTDGWSDKFKPIEKTYQAGIIYGLRPVVDETTGRATSVEVLLVDVFRCNRDRLNLFKSELFTKFGVAADRFEGTWDFEQYVRLAEPAYEALHVIGCKGAPHDPMVILSHEFMGMPTVLRALLANDPAVRTAFYAHEVASVREIVEHHAGHDLMFYNLLEQAEKVGTTLEDYFPQVRDYFKHPLVKAATHCDAIFAVGDEVGREMRFLDAASRDLPIRMIYNGIPAERLDIATRQAHRGRMIEYARMLFGVKPDYIVTHVARPVLSKGIWRDLRLLHELDGRLSAVGKTAVYFMLGTLAGQRRGRDVGHMERVYGWPVHHKRGYPDLCNGEEVLGDQFEQFNQGHEHVRVVLVNQFGWERRLCGLRMPEDMSIADIRRGTDVELGMSVYEPFGISQLEPLSFGAVCVPSSVCGCMGFARLVSDGELPANVLEANYTRLPGPPRSVEDILRIDFAQRDAVEAAEAVRLADELMRRLPTSEAQMAEMLESGWGLAQRICWEQVVGRLLLPAVEEIVEADILQ